jgi:hypothetical protein
MYSSGTNASLLEPGLRRKKMPMKSKDAGKNISEFHHGARYQKMKKKFGAEKANKVAQAAGFNAARKASAQGHKKGY